MNQRRYFCHACTNQGVLRDGVCSRCSSSFVEELGEETTGEDPRSFTLGTLGNPIQDLLASFLGTREQEGQEQSSNFRPPSPPANTATHPGQRRGFVMLGNPANPIRFSFGDSREDREMPSLSDFLANSFQPPPIHRETHPNNTSNQPDQQAGVGIGGYLQQLLSSLFNGPAGVPNVMFNNGQAQFGDYILSQAAFDRFIDDLMQNQQAQGPPPASKETIDSLPRGIVDKEWLDAQDIGDCSVCKDDFQIGDKNITLPCKHAYHPDCLIPWLEHNGTCPICRYSLSMSQEEHSRRQNEGHRRSTSDPTHNMPGSFGVHPDELD